MKWHVSAGSVIFFVFSGAEIQPHSQWNLGNFFLNFEKKIYTSEVFFFEAGHHTHKLQSTTIESYFSFIFWWQQYV